MIHLRVRYLHFHRWDSPFILCVLISFEPSLWNWELSDVCIDGDYVLERLMVPVWIRSLWGCVSHYITHKLLLPLWVGVEIKECSKDLWTSSQSHVSLLFSSQNILKWQEIVLFYLITIILYLKMDQTTSYELNMCLCKSALFKGKFIST